MVDQSLELIKEFTKDVAIALAVAILLWKDATPGSFFPSTEELAKIELGRILAHPIVFREHPWLKSRIAPLHRELVSEPWDVDILGMLERYKTMLKTDEELKEVGASIRHSSFADPAFDMIRRQGKKPRARADDMIITAREVAQVLSLDEDSYRDIEDGTRAQYTTIYSQLYPTRKSR